MCQGKTVIWNDFAGYNDPTKPIKVVTTYDKSVYGLGLLQQEFVQRDGATKFELIPPCTKPGESKALAAARFLAGSADRWSQRDRVTVALLRQEGTAQQR